MFSKLNANQKGMILVLVPVIFQLASILAVYMLLAKAADAFETTRKSKSILIKLHQNELGLARVNLFMTTGEYINYHQAQTVLETLRDRIMSNEVWNNLEVTDDPNLQEVIDQGKKLRHDINQLWDEIAVAFHRGHGAIFPHLRAGAREQAINIYTNQRKMSRLLVEFERKQIDQQPEELNTLRSALVTCMFLFATGSSLISFWLVASFARDIVRRLDLIAQKANLLAVDKATIALPLSSSSGSDEISELDAIITEAGETLKNAIAREAIVLNSTADVLCSIDSKLRFVAVGAACKDSWGYEPGELLGMALSNLLSSDTIEGTNSSFQNLAETDGEGRLENTVKCRSGKLKDFVWSVVWSAEQRVYFCVAHDVTELRAVDRLKQHFLSVASHDLRAPLTAVSINVSLLQKGVKGELPQKTLDELARVQINSNKLTSLVNELLELDKLEAGKLILDRSPVGMSDVCEAAKQSLFDVARKKSISIITPSNDAVVFAEEKRLLQIIENLVSNAIKYSPPNSTIEINLSKADGYCELSVKDQGSGISLEQQELIFDKFRQARNLSADSVEGSGLELAIVKALVQSHGGSVGVKSVSGQGSTFWAKLPLSASEKKSEDASS